ncbi:MAG TPA: hypothetical protein DDW87_00100 [Firmicutes bacterium]|nr:hypothetical protein [Bacillota bacterium]
MPFAQTLTLWVLVAVVMVVIALWQGKSLNASLIGLALLAATVLTGLAALHPVAQTTGLLGWVVGWIRNFLVYTILLSLLTKTPAKKSAKSGVLFATILILLDLLG